MTAGYYCVAYCVIYTFYLGTEVQKMISHLSIVLRNVYDNFFSTNYSLIINNNYF